MQIQNKTARLVINELADLKALNLHKALFTVDSKQKLIKDFTIKEFLDHFIV